MTDINKLGIGVMINMLCGNEESVKAWETVENKKITKLKLKDDSLFIEVEDGNKILLKDEGQSCCEHRYMTTEDDLNYHIGSMLLKAEVKEAPNEKDEDGYGEHEVLFLEVTTSNGSFQMANHNEHNGYYGGFSIRALKI